MPTYVYECAKCGEEMEEWQSFSDEPLKKHPGCGGKLAKVLQPVGIVFKGSGFHRTDSRAAKRSHSDRSSDGKADKESSDSSGKTEKSDSKAESSSSSSDSSKKSFDSKSSSDGQDSKKPSTSSSTSK
jgi:putative FmdB family regulatory protein